MSIWLSLIGLLKNARMGGGYVGGGRVGELSVIRWVLVVWMGGASFGTIVANGAPGALV